VKTRTATNAANTRELRRGFSIFDANDSRQIVHEILQEAPVSVDERVILNTISRWKNELVSCDEALKSSNDQRDQLVARIYARYESVLESCNAVDFDDLISLPVRILRANADILAEVQQGVAQLLVDEYQDTNSCQYELVKLLLGEKSVLTAVGDDDQSIYSWRGANPENLNSLARDFPELQVIKLEQNYRSCQRILRSANAVIAENPHLFEKALWSDLGIGESLRLSYCRDSTDEAEWVSADILSQQFRYNVRGEDIAILYRSNFQSRPLEQALRERGVSYQISGGSSFFDAAEIKDLLAYLRLMTNPSDDTAFLRVINRPRREIGAKSLEHIGHVAASKKTSLFDACLDADLGDRLTPRALTQVQNFANRLILLADNASRGDSVAVIRELLDQIDYDGWLADQSSSPKGLERARDNVEELLTWLQRLVDSDTEDGLSEARDFTALVAHIALMDMLSRQEDTKNDKDAKSHGDVQLMTLHAAKGLEFPHVYIIGMEEGVLPHHNSTDDEQIEEERRLAYVGMTRAKHRLTFTAARTRSRFGEFSAVSPSRFLDAIPGDDIQHLGAEPSADSAEQNQETGRDTLSSLKALLE